MMMMMMMNVAQICNKTANKYFTKIQTVVLTHVRDTQKQQNLHKVILLIRTLAFGRCTPWQCHLLNVCHFQHVVREL